MPASVDYRSESSSMEAGMKTWIRALGIACAVEVPLFTALVLTASPTKRLVPSTISTLGQVLVGYHILAIPVGMSVLTAWNTGTRPERAPGSDVVFWSSIFVSQMLLTTPLIALLLKAATYFADRVIDKSASQNYPRLK